MNKKTLNDYGRNVFSQYGEDGIIHEILRRTGIKSGLCVEFGAWDGVLLSNTANLWARGTWKAILIEADRLKFDVLKKVAASFNCIPINEFVKPAGEQSLESILQKEKIDLGSVKLLSIDIDGNEYHILNGLKTLRPQIIIAEYNPTIPPEMNIVSGEDAFFGSSASALTGLMKEKKYTLIAMTETNCIFIDDSFVHLFEDLEISFEKLFDRSRLTCLITNYKGDYAFSHSPPFGIGLPLNKNLIINGHLFYLQYSPHNVKYYYLKKSLKAAIINSIGVKHIEFMKGLRDYLLWKIKGMPAPAPTWFKRRVIRRYARNGRLSVLVETGTAGGENVSKFVNDFNKIYTVEPDPTTYIQGAAFLSDFKNITCLEGDYGSVVDKILKGLESAALFWLGAPHNGPVPARSAMYTPIEQELQAIFCHTIKDHVILIDNAGKFNGANSYPKLSDLKQMISETAPWTETVQDNDIIVIRRTT